MNIRPIIIPGAVLAVALLIPFALYHWTYLGGLAWMIAAEVRTHNAIPAYMTLTGIYAAAVGGVARILCLGIRLARVFSQDHSDRQ